MLLWLYLQAYMEQFREEMLVAERAVLYSIGFALDIQTPYKPLMNYINHYKPLMSEMNYKYLLQVAWNFVNDRYIHQDQCELGLMMLDPPHPLYFWLSVNQSYGTIPAQSQ